MTPTPPPPPTPRAEAKDVELLVLDVDGVMTDGSICYDDNGVETKRFNIRDGLGLRVWMRLGFKAAIITGRGGEAVRKRAAELGLDEVIERSSDKLGDLAALAERTGVEPERMAFLGDDWPDLAPMRRVGYPMAVADAEPLVKEVASFVTPRAGGHGAVRDATEHLLSARGLMEQAVSLYDAPA